jgi:hypothetical protein
MEKELLTLPEHMSSPPVYSGVRVTRSLFVLLYFFFWTLCFLIIPLVSSNSSCLFHLCSGSFNLSYFLQNRVVILMVRVLSSIIQDQRLGPRKGEITNYAFCNIW